MEVVRVNVFKSSHDAFVQMLQEKDIEFGEVKTFSNTIMASGMVLTVYGALQTAAPWAALAATLVAWIKSRSTRKVIITTKDNQVVHIEGLSIKEIERVLELAINLSVIDTNTESKP
jgi:hypothetical protein